MQIRQNTKRQFTNMTKHKKTKHKSDNMQNATKYECDKTLM